MVKTRLIQAQKAVGSTPTGGTKKKKYADLLAYINYNTYLCNIKLK